MRARAEVVGMPMRDGLFRRQERVALLGIGLVFNGLTVVMWPLAVLSNVTALQRFVILAENPPAHAGGLTTRPQVVPVGEAASGVAPVPRRACGCSPSSSKSEAQYRQQHEQYRPRRSR